MYERGILASMTSVQGPQAHAMTFGFIPQVLAW